VGISRIQASRKGKAASNIKAKKLVQGRQLRRKIARLEAKGYEVTIKDNGDKPNFHGKLGK
jgi:hypothetical protein